MEIIKLYYNLSTCQIDLQNNQKHRKAQTNRCADYYNCALVNTHLVEQYQNLSSEISQNILNQHFDTNELSNNFRKVETISSKIRDLQRSMPEIRKYIKKEAQNIELGVQQIANNLDFELMDEAEEWIDSVFCELERLKQERIEKIEHWKSTGKAVVKNTATAVGAVSSFLWKAINQK